VLETTSPAQENEGVTVAQGTANAATMTSATLRTPPQPADDAPHLLLVDETTGHPRPAVALSVRRGLSRHHRGERSSTPAPNCSACISIF